MSCFEDAPEFIEEDNRRFRPRNPVSFEQMTNKHEALLPRKIVEGKTVLDLGCCMGATGHWVLSQGAVHYTGIEFQKEYAESAQRLLNKYHPGKAEIHQTSIEKWLMKPDLPMYDVVCLLGVIYSFVDYFLILKLSTAITGSTICFEAIYADILKKHPNFCGVRFMDDQTINLARENNSLVGRGTRISPKGMHWLMREFGFVSYEDVILPKPITNGPDVYNRDIKEMDDTTPKRYLMRFIRTNVPLYSLSEGLQRGEGEKTNWDN
jgi:hypothetical protein